MAYSQHLTSPPSGSDDITHYQHTIAGGPGNERQKLTVEVISLVDDGQATPPILSVHGELDLRIDQIDELTTALGQARSSYFTARDSWIEGLR